tara:strand:- start:146 stop:892 length:747 start_codon:yes stop_codon:yes gene_type:complete
MSTYIKLYGVKRSCTNLVKLLFHDNFSNVTVLSNVLGWKHGNHPESVDWHGKDWDPPFSLSSTFSPLDFVSNDELSSIKQMYEEGRMKYVVCLKDPYSWLVSYSKYEARESLISRSVLSFKGINRKKLKEYISLWNDRHRNWSELLKNNPNATLIRYEDILKDADSALNKIAIFFDLEKIDEVIMPEFNLSRNPEAVGELPKQENKSFNKKDYYLNKKYLEYFNQDDFNIIETAIDKELLSYFGYETQ